MTTCFRSSLPTLIEDYLRVTGTAPSTFGKKSLDDPGFISRLRKGCLPRLGTIERVLDHINRHMDELLAVSESRRLQDEAREALAAAVEVCAEMGIDPINRTIMMPVPIHTGQPTRLRVVGGYA